MCGIAGLVGRPGTGGDDDPLEAALRTLSRRGPDGVGHTEGRLGRWTARLGVRQLRLVDRGDRQPVMRPSGARLAFNGEIYNHAALRQSLLAEGEMLHTQGDAEVLAALLEREGPEGLRRVEGSYAFAFLAPDGGPLLLGRDALGVRPLAFALLPDGLVFASTLTAIVATGLVRPRADLEALADVLRDGVIPTRRTALRGVRRVGPGEIVRIEDDLRVTTESIPEPTPEPDEAPDVLDALRAAVADRVRTDRGVAVLLSGGIDSALVAALAREAADVTAYTLTFPGRGAVDESRRARRTADRLGVPHVAVPCPRDPAPWVTATAAAFDEPFADASAVPTWGLGLAVSPKARVALTGTGGDEVFGGYRRYWLLGTGPWLRHVPAFVREPLSVVLDRSLPAGARMLRAAADPEGLYRGLLRLQPLRHMRELVGPLLAPAAEPEPRRGARTAAEAMAEDFVAYLPDDLLVKEDRALAAHGMEGRHPFLDRRVRRAARGLEIRGTAGRGHQKHVLRAFVKEVIDPDLARVPKRGFAFPVDELYRGPLLALARDVLQSARTRERGFLSPPGVDRLLREHVHGTRDAGAVVHALVMLELWARRMLDERPGGWR